MAIKEDQNGIIRHENGYWVAGQSGNPKGRSRQSATEEARNAVEPMSDAALEQLKQAVNEGKAWAITRVLDMRYGKPTDRIEVSRGDDLLGDLSDEQIDRMLAAGAGESPADATDGE